MVRHGLDERLAQRVYGLAHGYDDANDSARLADDPIHKLRTTSGSPIVVGDKPGGLANGQGRPKSTPASGRRDSLRDQRTLSTRFVSVTPPARMRTKYKPFETAPMSHVRR